MKRLQHARQCARTFARSFNIPLHYRHNPTNAAWSQVAEGGRTCLRTGFVGFVSECAVAGDETRTRVWGWLGNGERGCSCRSCGVRLGKPVRLGGEERMWWFTNVQRWIEMESKEEIADRECIVRIFYCMHRGKQAGARASARASAEKKNRHELATTPN